MRRYLVSMLRSEERDTSRVSLLFARTAEIRALPPSTTILLSAIAKKFLYLTSNCVAGTIFLSTIQAVSQLIETRWTVSVAVRRLQRLQASMIISSTREKHVSGVFIEAVSSQGALTSV